MSEKSGTENEGGAGAAPASGASLGTQVAHGMLWTLVMRWSVRCLGILSTLVLARLLKPADFGLVAMAMVMVELANVLMDFGVEWALIQNHKAERRHYDTAWSVRIMQNSIVSVGLAALTPLAIAFYDEPRMAWILPFLAISIFIRGFENIGLVKFQKDLTFSKDFQYFTAVKLVGVVANIALAFALKSYLALIISQVITSMVAVALSYKVSDYRPRWSLEAFREIWGYSQWNMVRGLANYINGAADRLIIGKSLGPTKTGYFAISNEMSSMATTELVAPLARALTPGFAKVKDEPERLKRIFFESLSGIAYLAMPVGMGILAVAPEMVPLGLGPGWDAVVPLLQILSLSAVSRAAGSIAGNLAVIHGYVRWIAITSWIQAGLYVLLLWPAMHFGGLMGIVGLKVALTAANVYFCMCILVWREGYVWRDFLLALMGAVFATLVMLGGLILGEYALFGRSPILAPLLGQAIPALPYGALMLHLVVKMLAGAGLYIAAAYGLWRLRGRPAGIEARGLAYAQQLMSRLGGKLFRRA